MTTLNTILTIHNNAVFDFTTTGNGSHLCYDCGAEFEADELYVEVGGSAAMSCPECGGRCANPDVIGVKEVITGTWKHEEGTGDFFVSDSGEEFRFSGADEEGENFFAGRPDRSAYVHVGELLDSSLAVVRSSLIGVIEIGHIVYYDNEFMHAFDGVGKVHGIVVRKEDNGEVYDRYTVIPIQTTFRN